MTRREAIADAAIHLVATRGLRGLTHRAVDAEAGLPPGSTSYYLRTRDALLTACVERMVQRDLAAANPMPEATNLADLLTGMVLGLTSHRRDDLLARYELALEAVRRPGLRTALVESGRQLRVLLAEWLDAYGVADAAEAAWPVAGMLDGLMYDRVAGAGSSLDEQEFAKAVRRTVEALLAGLKTSAPR